MSFIVKFFRGLWRAITWTRRFVFNLLFLVVLALVIALVLSPRQEPLPESGPLFVVVSGVLVDEETYISPTSRLLNRSEKRLETNLRDLIETIGYAAADPKITGLVLQLDYFEGGGISKTQELGKAIEAFRQSGKPVIAFSDTYSQQSYFLASYADDIYMHNLGNVLLTGYGMYRNYYKDALAKLAVNVHVFKVGQYKDFVEPYIRNSMSDASREHTSQWLNQLWQDFTAQIERRRAIDPGTIDFLIANIDQQIAATGGDMAALALNTQLVDFVGTRPQYQAKLIERFGEGKDGGFLNIPYRGYQKRVTQRRPGETGNIGLIVASGNILDGWQPRGSIGGDSLSELIRIARQDENLDALVLRIDSGGGSAFASELIRNELELARAEGLPVVVSMGAVAASGGYWIAMAADQVWATPNTITGSIGVFGLLPTFEDSLAKIGVHTDGIGTTEIAGALRLDRPLDTKAATVYQQGIEAIYNKFLSIVADSRGSTVDQIHEVAQGRVWTGKLALELGLVDKLGYLDDAIAAAAERAGVDQISVKLIEQPKSTQELLMEQILDQAEATGDDGYLQDHWQSMPPQTLQWLERLTSSLEPLLRKPPPRVAWAACFACFAP